MPETITEYFVDPSLTGDSTFSEGDHRPEQVPDDYEETVSEIRRQYGDNWKDKVNIRIAMPAADEPNNSTEVENSTKVNPDILCEEYIQNVETETSNETRPLHFPHRLEIGVQVALNMLTLGSWLAVLIGSVLEALAIIN